MYKPGGYLGFYETQQQESKKLVKYSFSENKSKYVTYKVIDKDTKKPVHVEMPLSIFTPVKAKMPNKYVVTVLKNIASKTELKRLLIQLFDNETLFAVDIETTGLRATHDSIVGIGIASWNAIAYFDLESCGTAVWDYLLGVWLARPEIRLIAHNMFFDSCFLFKQTGIWYNWVYDTQAIARQLMNEGHPGQKWGLKDLQIQLLNWDVKGDIELDEWLITNRYITTGYKTDATTEQLIEQYHEGKLKVDKSKMCLAPPEILGYYCGLDVASTYQLYAEIVLPAVTGQSWEKRFWDYHELFVENVYYHVEQQLSGITIDKDMIDKHLDFLDKEIQTAETQFVQNPVIERELIKFDQIVLNKHLDKEPKKQKSLPKIGQEPEKFKKNGEVSKNWMRWVERKTDILSISLDDPKYISKNWINWNETYEQLKQENHFNPNSADHLQWLFYQQLKFPVVVRTDSGLPSTGVKALPGFGEYGQMLKKIKDLVKEEGYVKGCQQLLDKGPDGYYRIYPQFRMPGTLTCRLAGSGGLNIQQLPKSRGYLNCWKPRPGYAWVSCDHTALEMVVLAELSQDKNLFKIYGPNAKPNDIYLFNGSQLPGIGDKILKEGYDPENPDPDVIKHVKKVCKKERGISKVITLGAGYGMGSKKLKQTLELQGIKVSMEEARQMHRAYWELYSGVKQFEKYLNDEWEYNQGYVINGIGRPVCCSEDYRKDIVNRVIQSTGHDIHMIYIRIINQLFARDRLTVNGIVWDFHDESIVECLDKDKNRVRYLMETEAYEILNTEYLQGQIPLKGGADIIANLAAAKCEG